MNVVVQRVTLASVRVGDRVVGAIQRGLCLLVGIHCKDTEAVLVKMASKILGLKLFPSKEDSRPWKDSVLAIEGGGILAISQFTLQARCDKGCKPDFHMAMNGAAARAMFDRFVELLRGGFPTDRRDRSVQTGAFGEYMQVSIENDGPVTIVLDVSSHE